MCCSFVLELVLMSDVFHFNTSLFHSLHGRNQVRHAHKKMERVVEEAVRWLVGRGLLFKETMCPATCMGLPKGVGVHT